MSEEPRSLEDDLAKERIETQRLKRELREARRRIRDLERVIGSWSGLFGTLSRKVVNIRSEFQAMADAREERKRLSRDADKIRQAGLFDEAWYLKQYPDVARAGQSPLAHYLRYGWEEGRDPSPDFSTVYYLESNRDVAAGGMNPLVHYLSVGRLEGRKTKGASHAREAPEFVRETVAPHFDAAFYCAQNPDVVAAGYDPLMHFLEEGWLQGRDPSAHFSVQHYLKTYRDVAEAGVNPYYHYIITGRREGRRAVPSAKPTAKSA